MLTTTSMSCKLKKDKLLIIKCLQFGKTSDTGPTAYFDTKTRAVGRPVAGSAYNHFTRAVRDLPLLLNRKHRFLDAIFTNMVFFTGQ
jgi:hypothetical protein